MENLAQTDVNTIYTIIGGLVITYLGTIATGFVFLLKSVWKLAKFHSKIEKLESDINAAHVKIRQLEGSNEI